MASYYPDEGRSADEGGEEYPELPSRTGGADYEGAGYPAHTEARAELRDRETYYTELRFAVHCQSRDIPVPRTPADDALDAAADGSSATTIDGESWDDMIARFGDTWT